MANTPKDVKVNVHVNPALAAAALRKLVEDVFPTFGFIYRPTDVRFPESGGNLDFLDSNLEHVVRTRPATGEEVQMLLAFETVRTRLAQLLMGKAVDLSVAENRVADYDALLSEALKWAPELAAVPNPDRLLRLRGLVRGEEFRSGPTPQNVQPVPDILRTYNTKDAIARKESGK